MTAVVTDRSDSFRPDINGLRAIAVIVVILFHFGVPGFSGGFLGVDVFFVISGFLMTKIIVTKLAQGRFSLGGFLMSRVRRIFPALAALCTVLLAVGWLSFDPASYRALALHAASALSFISNIVFWQEVGYFDASAHEKWLLHTWSLSAEWQFYLIYPVLLMTVWRVFKSSRAIVVTIVAAFVLSLSISVVMTPLRPSAAYYLLPTRAWEMMAGGLVFTATPRIVLSRFSSSALECVGLLFIIGGSIFLSSRDLWPGYLAVFPVAGTAMVMLAKNTSSIVTSNRLAAFVGETSYSIYLWHWPIVVWIGYRGYAETATAMIAGIMLSIGAGYLSFRIVEENTRHAWIQSRRTRELLAYGMAVLVLTVVSLMIVQQQGFGTRLQGDRAEYQDVVKAIGDWGHPGSNCEVRAYETYCFEKGSSDRLLMFVGDSHAEQWYPRYGEHGVENSRSTLFFTRGACLPIRGTERTIPGANCAEFAERAWREVFRRHPEKLVVSSVWLTYFYYQSGAFRSEQCIRRGGECEQVIDENGVREVMRLLEKDVHRAVETGIQVYILGPTPMGKGDYPKTRLQEIAAQHLPFPVAKPQSIEPLKPQFHTDGTVYSRTTVSGMLAAVAERTGAVYIDLEHFMCPDEVCSFVNSAGLPIYKDSGHLRREFVRSAEMDRLDREIGLR